MLLPGGLIENGIRRRDFAFRPISGVLELALAESAESAANTPQAVTRALAAVLDHLGGEPATPQRVAGLCVADRQFLMRELELHLGHNGGWFQVACAKCDAQFDFYIDYAELPVQEAGAGYPLVNVKAGRRKLAFRLPNGADQEAIVGMPPEEAKVWLARQLMQAAEGVGELDDKTVVAAETALEAMSPGVVVKLQANCPECGFENHVDLNPYRALDHGSETILHEVHQVAAHYHWGEAEILALPRMRRQRYLQLIDRARGMVD